MSTLEMKNIIRESLESEDAVLLEQIVEVIKIYKSDLINSDSVLNNAQKKELDKIRKNMFLVKLNRILGKK